MKIHERENRGQTRTGWLDSRHTFSFGGFQDPSRMGFRTLRVVNDDRVIPGAGFGTHGHRDMEIITYVISGALAHKDSLGNGSVIRPGELQRMSAGTGIEHSEFNHSDADGVHFLQIWVLPEKQGLPPGYEQKPALAGDGYFKLIGDRLGTDGAITIHQDVGIYLAHLPEGKEASYHFQEGRGGFLQLVRGEVSIDGEKIREGDGLEINQSGKINVKALNDSEIMLFDLG